MRNPGGIMAGLPLLYQRKNRRLQQQHVLRKSFVSSGMLSGKSSDLTAIPASHSRFAHPFLKTSQPPAPHPPYSPSHRRLRAAPESSAPGKAPGRCRRCSGSASRLPGKRPRKDAAGRLLRCGNDILMKPFLEIGCRLFLLLGFPVASFIRTNPFY